MPDPIEALRGALAGRYAVERELGAGGMATVYPAEDVRHRRKVAVKVLRLDLTQSVGPDRFLREIEIAARLQHPHILPLYDSGEAGGFLFYVMPSTGGRSAHSAWATGRRTARPSGKWANCWASCGARRAGSRGSDRRPRYSPINGSGTNAYDTGSRTPPATRESSARKASTWLSTDA